MARRRATFYCPECGVLTTRIWQTGRKLLCHDCSRDGMVRAIIAQVTAAAERRAQREAVRGLSVRQPRHEDTARP